MRLLLSYILSLCLALTPMQGVGGNAGVGGKAGFGGGTGGGSIKSYIQNVFVAGTGSAVTSTQTPAFGSANTAGNTILVGIESGASSATSITGCSDLQGNTYAVDSNALETSSGAAQVAVARASNIIGGSANKVTCTSSAAQTFFSVYAEEINQNLTLDGSPVSGVTASPATANSLTISTSVTHDLIFYAANWNQSHGTGSAGTNFTQHNPSADGFEDWVNVSSTGSQTAAYSWTGTTTNSVAIAVAYK
jgi:hypothetical protein